jgi:hypothetical protein
MLPAGTGGGEDSDAEVAGNGARVLPSAPMVAGDLKVHISDRSIPVNRSIREGSELSKAELEGVPRR